MNRYVIMLVSASKLGEMLKMVPKQVEFPDSSFFAIGFSHQMFTEETDGNHSSECISFTER